MTIDELLAQVRKYHLILINEREVWPSPSVTSRLKRAMRTHRSGLALLIRWSDSATCPTRDLHRQHFYYSHGRYICGMCEQLRPEVEGRAA